MTRVRLYDKLFYPVRDGDVKATARLLSLGAPRNVTFEHASDLSSLMGIAITQGHIGVVNVLCAHGANVNGLDMFTGLQPVHSALACPIPVLMLKALHRLGADMNGLCAEGLSALQKCFNGDNHFDSNLRYSVVQTLIELGADVNAHQESYAPILLFYDRHYQHVSKDRRVYDTTRLLVEAGADLNSTQNEALNLLSIVVRANDMEMVKALVHWGALIDRDDVEHTDGAMYQAIFHDFANIVIELIKMGADINRPMPGIYQGAYSFALTPVIVAALMGRLEIVKTLHSLGADLNPCQMFSAYDVMLGKMPSEQWRSVLVPFLIFAPPPEEDVIASFRYIHMRLCRAMARKKRSCHSCGQRQSRSMKLKKCGRCRAAYYCSKTCHEAAHRQDLCSSVLKNGS